MCLYIFLPKFLNVQTAAKQKEKEELQKLKEKEAELLVRFFFPFLIISLSELYTS